MHKQVAIIKYKNGPTIGYRFKSDVELSFVEVLNWLSENDDFDDKRDKIIIAKDVINVTYIKNKIKCKKNF
jgi:hypothetical protein